MKKLKYVSLVLVFAGSLFCSSCGTICGGAITECQKRGPAQGGIHRQIRPAALIFDILTFPVIGLVIDFVDGAMYVPCNIDNGKPQPHYNEGRN
jgi:hypothetical protein